MPNNGNYIGAGAGAIIGGGAGASAGSAIGGWITNRLGKTNLKDAFVMYSYAENPKYRFEQTTGKWIVSGTVAGQLYAQASGESPDFWTEHGVEQGREGYRGVVVIDGIAYDANRYGEDARGHTGIYQGRTWKDLKGVQKGIDTVNRIGSEVGGAISKSGLDTKTLLIIAVVAFLLMRK